MPVYEYICTACATRVEVIHRVDESGPAVCTSCGGPMRKALSPPAIVFRGSGWAKKDARPTGNRAGGDGDKHAASPEPTSPKPSESTTVAGDKPGS